MKKTIVVIILVLVVGLVGYSALIGPVTQETKTPDQSVAQLSQQAEKQERPYNGQVAKGQPEMSTPVSYSSQANALDASVAERLQDRVLGREDAPVTLIEYASFTCPHCAHFHQTVYPMVKQDFIDTGKVKFIFRDYPFDRFALMASITTRCVPMDKYFETVKLLFAKQDVWSKEENPEGYFRQVAALQGADAEKFRTCLFDPGMQEGIANIRLEGAQKYSVASTPSFVINDIKFNGRWEYENFSKALNEAYFAATTNQ